MVQRSLMHGDAAFVQRDFIGRGLSFRPCRCISCARRDSDRSCVSRRGIGSTRAPTERSLRVHNLRKQVIPPSSVPLPKQWPNHAKTAFLSAVALAHQAMVWSVSWCVNSRIERVRVIGEKEQLKAEVAMLKEELRIKNARLDRIPAASRPHYPPTERLAILALKAMRGWNNTQAAKAFHLCDATIASWLTRIEETGPGALVQTPVPVNKFQTLWASWSSSSRPPAQPWEKSVSRRC